MYLQNKYYNWYNNIINAAKSRKNIVYTEKHHIIPRSLGGANTKNNLIRLSAKEHFICHLLLPKMLSKVEDIQKMNYALWMMMNIQNENQTTRYKINARHYSILKEKLSIVFSIQHKGKHLSEEHKRKISETRKRKIASGEIEVNKNKEKYKHMSERMKGTTLSAETKNKISKANKGKKRSEEQKQYLSTINIGKTIPKEIKEKISKTLKQQYQNGRKPIKGMLGKHLTQEAKNKISRANKGKKRTPEMLEKMSNLYKGRTWKLIDGKRVWSDR